MAKLLVYSKSFINFTTLGNSITVNYSFYTSQIFYKVLQLHLPLWLYVGTVHVRVEEDDSECQDEDRVRVAKLSHHTRVADAVALARVTLAVSQKDKTTED